jgi:hypothetical protein
MLEKPAAYSAPSGWLFRKSATHSDSFRPPDLLNFGVNLLRSLEWSSESVVPGGVTAFLYPLSFHLIAYTGRLSAVSF